MAGLLDFVGSNAGALAGGLLGFLGNSGSSKANETTATRDPWGPAQPYIMRNLQDQQELQDYYKKNPFNAQQQAGYSNIFADADHFRSSVAPGLMDFANKGMTSSYERQRGGSVGSGAGYGGDVRPGGVRSGGQGPFSVAPYVSATQASMASTGPMQDGSAPPTVSPSGGRFGQVDFAANNPYTNGAIKPAEQKAYEAMTTGGLLNGSGGPLPGGRGGNGGNGAGPSNLSDRQWAAVKEGRDAINPDTGQPYGFTSQFDQDTFKTVQNLFALGLGLGDIQSILSANDAALTGLNDSIYSKDGIFSTPLTDGGDSYSANYASRQGGGGGGGNGVGGYGGQGYGGGTDGSSGGYGSSYGSGSAGGW